MDLSDAEFLAEEQVISIIPCFNSPSIYLFRKTIGPFEAALSIDVPIWAALYLKQRRKCNLISPPWLNVELLENLKEAETNDHLFVEMPNSCYLEIAQLMLQYAYDDVPDAPTIKTLICDLADIRMAKLKKNMDMFVKSGSSYAQVNNLTQFEICRIRDVFTTALDILHELREASREPDDDASQ